MDLIISGICVICVDVERQLPCSLNMKSYGSAIACECAGDFDGDEDQDGTDAATFKSDFGRGGYNSPCIAAESCNGDFDCDTDVDGTDAALFKSDFGRGGYNHPCPPCDVPAAEWCNYN